FNVRGLVKGEMGDLEGAVADLSRAIELDPRMAAAYETRWLVLSRLGRTEPAQKDWDQNVKLSPENQGTLQLLNDNLLPIYKKYPDPKTTNDFVSLGNALYAAGYYVQAAGNFRRAFDVDDFNPVPLYDLGLALAALNYFDAAVDAYKKCIDVDDRYVFAIYELGELYRYQLSRYDEAITYLDKAIAVKPDYAIAWSSRGAAKKSKGDLPGALKDLDKALELDPKSAF